MGGATSGRHPSQDNGYLRHILAVAVGTCLYTAKRLDGMQQSRFNMALATEASYFQVLQPTSETSDNLVQVSTILRNHSDGLSQEVPQTEQDLENNYQLAKRHMNLFQTVVCEPLASTGLEVSAKIKSLAELDEREGGADILCCEVWCDNLQEVQDSWDMLKDLDGVEIVSARDFFAIASFKKCLQVVVSVQGYFATVALMEKSLSAWEAQKGLSNAADSLGLLDKTKASAWEVSRLQRDSEVPRCVFVATALLRLVALFSCYIIGAVIGGSDSSGFDMIFGLYDGLLGLLRLSHCTSLYDKEYCLSLIDLRGLRMLPMTLPFLTCFLILLWEMLSCCCCCLCCCKRRRSFKIRPRPTQIWYRKYLGVQGCHYAFKVAALQFLTVVMQGLAKASLFRTIQDTHGSEALWASTTVQCFMVLLCNILFPAMILVMPNYVFSRVASALLDAVLDVGYMLTSISLYVVFATSLALTNIFLSSFLNYMSIYICIAHVLCVCRSLETADWIALFQVPRAAPACKAWKRMILSSAYTLTLLAFVGIAFGGIESDSSHGLCPPCECSAVAPTSLLLERCVITTGYVAQRAPEMEFNLTNRNITEVLPDAFIARGEHQKVRSVSLRGNHLTELPEGLFRDLLQQRDIDTLDLADNRIVTLSRGVFRADSFCYVGILDMSRNQLQELHAKTFQNLNFDYKGILNMSQNKLQVLHAEAFHGLTFGDYGTLDMSQNKLQELHAEAFHGLTFGRYGILDMSQNKLQELPPNVFPGISPLITLDLAENELVTLPSGVFSGLLWLNHLRLGGNRLRSLGSRPLYYLDDLEELHLEQNQLTDLDEDVFISRNEVKHDYGYCFHCLKYNLLELNLGGNRLRTLPGGIFNGFRRLRTLQLQSNQLARLPQQLFQNLSSLKLLNLSQNALDDLPPDLFDGLKLKVIDLSRNKLRTLNATLFDLESLTTLDLRGNRLTDATLQDLARLKVELHVD